MGSQAQVQAADGIVLGLVCGQLGFQLHDAGHNQMFDRRWMSALVAFLTADVLLGVRYGWWVRKHNRHHANPNHLDLDPDVNNPAIAYTPEQAVARPGPLRTDRQAPGLLVLSPDLSAVLEHARRQR